MEVIVDNDGPGFAAEGTWNSSTRDPGFEGRGYLWHFGRSKNQPEQAKAVFTPDLPEPGAYEVLIKWAASKAEDRATNAPYTVRCAEGEKRIQVNLCDLSRAGKWHSLGIFRFDAGPKGTVTLSNDANDTVVADAVRFVHLPGVTINEGDVLFADDFSGGLGAWAWEGCPRQVVEVRDGALYLDTRDEDYKGYEAINIWCKKPLAGDFVMEWDLEPLAPKPEERKAANLLFSFCARYQDPFLDVIQLASERTGHYAWLTGDLKTKSYRGKYDQHRIIPLMDNYSISYYRLAKPYRLVARRNPGFHLLAEFPHEEEQLGAFRHKVTIEKRGDGFRLLQNGTEMAAVKDEAKWGPVLTDGYFCLRLWRAAARVYGVKVTRP